MSVTTTEIHSTIDVIQNQLQTPCVKGKRESHEILAFALKCIVIVSMYHDHIFQMYNNLHVSIHKAK